MSSGKIVSIRCHGPKDLRLEERDPVAPGEGEATVAIEMTGICGSDLHYYLHGANGDFKIIDPLVLGHEAGGIVTAVGPEPASPTSKNANSQSRLKVGDRVAIECGHNCGGCRMCKEGRYNLCKNMRFCSSAKSHPHVDGTLQDQMNHPVSLLHKLPDGCSFEAAALAEPLCVVLHAIRRSGLRAGDRVLVLGAGAVGLLALALARAQGATTTIAVDIDQSRLDFAKENGWATGTHCLERGPRVSGADAMAAGKKSWEGLKADDIVTRVEDLDEGFDIVFECTGVESCMQMAVYAARAGGKAMYIGMGTSAMLLPTGPSLIREVDIMGVFRYANVYPEIGRASCRERVSR